MTVMSSARSESAITGNDSCWGLCYDIVLQEPTAPIFRVEAMMIMI
jgi:hypothetical protein